MEREMIVLFSLFLFLFIGCIGQAPPPAISETPVTSIPSPTSATIPPTQPPSPTIPPSTTPPTLAPTSPPEEVMHYKDFVGVPKDSELGTLFDIFMREVRDDDGDDYAFGEAYQSIVEYSNTKPYKGVILSIVFNNIPKPSPYVGPLTELNNDSLKLITEINPKTRKVILDYITKYGDNNIVFAIEKTEMGPYVIFIGSGFPSTYPLERYKSLTRLDCFYGFSSSKCISLTIPWREAGFFFIISEKSGDAFLKYRGVLPLVA